MNRFALPAVSILMPRFQCRSIIAIGNDLKRKNERESSPSRFPRLQIGKHDGAVFHARLNHGHCRFLPSTTPSKPVAARSFSTRASGRHVGEHVVGQPGERFVGDAMDRLGGQHGVIATASRSSCALRQTAKSVSVIPFDSRMR